MENLDQRSRRINYLRVSVTDRCNLRCQYCYPLREIPWMNHGDILSFEEILEVIRAGVEVGVRKVRFTGGEPLVRKGIPGLVRSVSGIPGIRSLGLTTNGVLLEDLARPLFQSGLNRINVSLDTLNPMKFIKITGRDHYFQVWKGIEAALSEGFETIKLNMVVIRGMNDDELEPMARLSLDGPFSVRFIEYMPIGPENGWVPSKFVPVEEMKARLGQVGRLLPISGSTLDGPSQRFRFPGAAGEIGFIGAVSQHFCTTCNRLRLTSEGRLRPCLMSDLELDLKGPLRRRGSREELRNLFRTGIALKPAGHHLSARPGSSCHRTMSAIGG